MRSAYNLVRSSGRIRMQMAAWFQGKDLVVCLEGGEAHVGAVALATPRREQVLQCEGHRDGEIAVVVARRIAQSANCHVAVACGIHYDRITEEEIAAVRHMAQSLADSLLERITGGKSC